jgi:hypothetical protein
VVFGAGVEAAAGGLSSAGPVGGRHHAGAADPVDELAHQPAALLLGGGARTPTCPEPGVQVDYNVVHLRTSLVQLFVLLQNFEKVVQMIELNRFGGAPNGYPLHPYPELKSVASRLDSATARSDSVVVVLIWLMQTSNPCLSC